MDNRFAKIIENSAAFTPAARAAINAVPAAAWDEPARFRRLVAPALDCVAAEHPDDAELAAAVTDARNALDAR